MRSLCCIVLVVAVAVCARECETQWRGNVKSQEREHVRAGWAYATVAFIENAYRSLSCNDVFLSVKQVIDGARDCESEPVICAIQYVEKFGIMSEHSYRYFDGIGVYDSRLVMPIRVSGAQQICENCADIDCAIECTRAQLRVSPIIAAIDAHGLDVVRTDGNVPTRTCIGANHFVLITNIAQVGGRFVVEFQNSWGVTWGARGFGYLNFTREEFGAGGPRSIFSQMFVARVW